MVRKGSPWHTICEEKKVEKWAKSMLMELNEMKMASTK